MENFLIVYTNGNSCLIPMDEIDGTGFDRETRCFYVDLPDGNRNWIPAENVVYFGLEVLFSGGW